MRTMPCSPIPCPILADASEELATQAYGGQEPLDPLEPPSRPKRYTAARSRAGGTGRRNGAGSLAGENAGAATTAAAAGRRHLKSVAAAEPAEATQEASAPGSDINGSAPSHVKRRRIAAAAAAAEDVVVAPAAAAAPEEHEAAPSLAAAAAVEGTPRAAPQHSGPSSKQLKRRRLSPDAKDSDEGRVSPRANAAAGGAGTEPHYRQSVAAAVDADNGVQGEQHSGAQPGAHKQSTGSRGTTGHQAATHTAAAAAAAAGVCGKHVTPPGREQLREGVKPQAAGASTQPVGVRGGVPSRAPAATSVKSPDVAGAAAAAPADGDVKAALAAAVAAAAMVGLPGERSRNSRGVDPAAVAAAAAAAGGGGGDNVGVAVPVQRVQHIQVEGMMGVKAAQVETGRVSAHRGRHPAVQSCVVLECRSGGDQGRPS